MSGCSIAATMRRVISASPMPKPVCTEPIDPVELREQLVVVVGRAVGQDVGLGPDQHARCRRARRRSCAPARSGARSVVGGDVVAEAVRGRVVGDRHVLVAALAGGRAPSPRSCCARRRRSCGSAGRRGGRRARPARGSADRAAAPRARRGPRAARARCRSGRGLVDLLLGRAARVSPVVSSVIAVLGDVQPAAHRASRSAMLCCLGSGEVLQQVAELVGRDDAQVHAHAVVRAGARAPFSPVEDASTTVELGQRAAQRARVARRRRRCRGP